MSQIATISEFLLQAGTDFRVFDMGRTIRPISSQQFLDQENNIIQPAYPRAGYAWYGLVFWNRQLSEQHYIWFVKLPLDEQGQLVAASRNHFLQIIVDALGAQLESAEEKNGQLPENPYSFTPNQQQLADFNSISRHSLGLEKSRYFDIAIRYIDAPHAHDWNQVPLQGLADFAAAIQAPENLERFKAQFENLHDEVKFALCLSVENQPLNDECTAVISDWLMRNDSQPLIWQHGLRALCQSVDTQRTSALLAHCLSSSMRSDTNLLTVIAGRLWERLTNDELFREFCDALAEVDQHTRLFAAVYTDLVQIPLIRPKFLAMLRWTDKSPVLTQAVGKLFSGQ